MDNMLPSPGVSIPSIGTPLHQPDDDMQILPSAAHQQQQQQQIQQHHTTAAPPDTSSGFPGGFTPHSLMQPQTPVSHALLEEQLNCSVSTL